MLRFRFVWGRPVKDPNDLPADIRDDIMRFRDAYRTPDAAIETRHLDLYSGYVHDSNRSMRPWLARDPQRDSPDRDSRGA